MRDSAKIIKLTHKKDRSETQNFEITEELPLLAFLARG